MLHYGSQLACPLLSARHDQLIRITAAFFGFARFEWFPTCAVYIINFEKVLSLPVFSMPQQGLRLVL